MICVYYTYEEVRFKELAHAIVRANKSEIYFQRYFISSLQTQGGCLCCSFEENAFFLTSAFALIPFN